MTKIVARPQYDTENENEFRRALDHDLALRPHLHSPNVFRGKQHGPFYDNGGALINVKAHPYNAVGDDTADDTTPLQGPVDEGGTAFLPVGTYKTTDPITQSTPSIIEGTGENSIIHNATSGEHVLSLNPLAAESSFVQPVIRNLALRGTSTTSHALHMDLVSHGVVENVDCLAHPGVALYMESNDENILQGCSFCEIRNVLAQPSQAVNAIVDVKGIGNRFIGIRAREAEIGVLLQNVISASVDGAYIESNNRGTAQTGIRVEITGQDESSQAPAMVRIRNSYFENNPKYAVHADKGSYVTIDGGLISGGATVATKVAASAVKLDGGGRMTGVNCAGGTKVESASGVVEVRGCYNVYGKVSEVYFADVMPPFLGKGTNSVTKSWFDTDPAWVAGGTTAPTITQDTTVGFLGKNSKKIAFASGVTGFGVSRAYMSNAEIAVTDGSTHYSVIAFKASRAGEVIAFRHDGAAGQDKTVNVITSTDWQVLIMAGVAAGTGNCGVYCYVSSTDALGSAMDVWIGGLARSLTPDIALLNGEGPSIGETAVGVQNLVVDGTAKLTGALMLEDGITAPATAAGFAQIYVDTADGDLKVKFGDGTVKVLSADT